MAASVGEVLVAARVRLAAVSRNPRRDADVLLAHLFGWDAAALLTHPERVLTAEEETRFESYLSRRLASEPIQYITGEQEFFGLSLAVTPAVLIPRPETEHLVEAALARIPREGNVRILDVGTGSGAIAIALAWALPHAHITAVDVSTVALVAARGNAERHRVEDRITFQASDLLASLSGARFDAVVANPPYIADGEELEIQVSAYEPHAALFAGPTGLEIYRRLIPQAAAALDPGGWLLLEIGYGQQPGIEAMLAGWSGVGFVDDLQGIPRVAVAQKACAA